jgi:hypothetical protein
MNYLQPKLSENFELLIHMIISRLMYPIIISLGCNGIAKQNDSIQRKVTSKAPVVVEGFNELIESPLLHDFVEADNRIFEVKPDFLPLSLVVALSITVPFAIDATLMIC